MSSLEKMPVRAMPESEMDYQASQPAPGDAGDRPLELPVATEHIEDHMGLLHSAAAAVHYRNQKHKFTRGLVGSIVSSTVAIKATYGSYADFEDSVQNAAVGFIKKAEDFDQVKANFSSFILPWIVQAMSRGICNTTTGVRYPDRAVINSRITPVEFVPLEDVADTGSYGFNEESDGYGESMLPEEDQALTPRYDRLAEAAFSGDDQDERMDKVLAALDGLPDERARNMIRLYFGFDGECKTQRQIGELYGLSPQRIGYILNITYSNLRSIIEKPAVDEDVVQRKNQARLQELVREKLANGGRVIDGIVYN